MNLNPDIRTLRNERSLGAVLRAVGALLVALGGDHDGPAAERARPSEPPLRALGVTEIPSSAIPPTRARAERAMNQPPRATWGAEEPMDDVSALLADARARAQALIDEAVERADVMLREQSSRQTRTQSAGLEQAIEQVRRLMSDIATEVRALHLRLDSIETLLRSMPAPGLPLGASPAYGAPPAYPRPGYVPMPPPAYSYAPAAPAPAAAAPPPSSAMPPPLSAPPPRVEATPPPAAASAPTASTESRSPNGTGFDPDGGSVALRISPVAGFQGLMRVQDALVRLQGIREAGVEAYAQGEARLRLQLAGHVEPEHLASLLGELLGRPARVTSASVSERIVQVALE